MDQVECDLARRSECRTVDIRQDILQKTLTKLRENIVREQVVGTKRFDGPIPFKSDPAEIVFKVCSFTRVPCSTDTSARVHLLPRILTSAKPTEHE